MKNDGATNEQITSVLNKLKNNEQLDSESGNVDPSQTIVEEPKANTNLMQQQDLDSLVKSPVTTSKTLVYPDGSYKKISLSFQADQSSNQLFNSEAIQVTPLGKVEICGWLHVEIYGSDEMGSVGYTGKVGINTSGENDQITSVGSDWVHMLYGSSAQDRVLHITRKTEIASRKISAKADMHFDEDWIAIQKTMYLKLHVGHYIGDKYGVWGQYSVGYSGDTRSVNISY